MALFSQRFWMQLSALDAKVVATQRGHQASSSRLLVGRRLVTGASLVEYWIDLMQTTRSAGAAVTDLNHFCTGRSKGAATAPLSGRKVEPSADVRQSVASSPALG
jgi:hypothetical protein